MRVDQEHAYLDEEAIRFYCGLGEKHYNHHPVVTGPYACVSPIAGHGAMPACSYEGSNDRCV